MRFSFLHAADLHLGSPLSGLATKNEDIARRFAAASREAFTALVTQAVEAGVAFVLIAGDIYDGDWKDTSIGLFFNREVARLDRAGIPVFIIRVVSENIALAYPAPVPGWLNIGMLHTSCESPGAHAVYAPCSIQDLVSRGYDYWALGHVHERAVLHEDPWVVYPGNLQGRSVRECGPKGAVLVDVADGRIEGVRPLVLDRARWLNLAVPVDGARDEAGVLEAVSDAARLSLAESGDRLSAVRVTLTGDTPLHAALKSSSVHLRDEIQAHLHRLHEDAWLETLRIATGEPPSRSPAPDAETRVDAASLLAGMEHDPEIRARAESLLALVAGKIPGGVDNAALPDLDTLLADARATAIGRAMLAEGR